MELVRLFMLIYLTLLPAIAIGSAVAPGVYGIPNVAEDTPHTRKYFHTGGVYASDGAGQEIFRDQMYVEHLIPIGGPRKKYPLVLIHGQAQTGTNWLNKPDQTPGWSSYFLRHGYELYIIDQTYRARSPYPPPSTGANLTLTTYSALLLQQRFTATRQYALWPQCALQSQWPGSGVKGDAYFDAYYASTVQFLSGAAQQQRSVQAAGAALLDRIGKPVVLLAHSQGGLMPWVIADARPKLARAIVGLEPSGPPFREAVFGNASARAYGLTDIPLAYDPPVVDPAVDLVRATLPAPAGITGAVPCTLQAEVPPPRQLVNLKGVPVLLVTAEASYHVPYDYCTAAYLNQAGVRTEHWYLNDKGVRGNGHLMFLEKNSDQVAGVVERWIARLR